MTPIVSQVLADIDTVTHGFFSRMQNDDETPLNFDYRKGDPYLREKSYKYAGLFLGVSPKRIYVTNQVHGDGIEVLRTMPDETSVRGGVENDAVMTDVHGVALTVLTADCVPILIADVSGRAVAAVHAGWRGTALEIGKKAVRVMTDAFDLVPGDLAAAVGPAIGPCCYRVGPEVLGAMRSVFSWADSYIERGTDGHGHLDLQGINREVLVDAGLDRDRVEVVSRCTACDEELFYSYRRDGDGTGRMLSAIVLNI
ncbi:MAG: peptidoglycan editing factor PgeF [Deltaproteobacteria bacterium]|nr:peptidoglycan editing factor PgeF [Candidatus Zymogenaceae bacterium]